MAENEIGTLAAALIDMVLRAPHLYLFTLLYWALIAAVLVSRYPLRRRRISEVFMVLVVVTGCVSAVLAFVDVALRGRELIQVSLVLYLAVPIGIGRFLIRKWDRRPIAGWRGVLMRETTYVTGFVIFVALSVADGDPWWFTRPSVDRSSILAIVESTNWLHLMATVFGALILIEAVLGATRARPRRS